ncbi:MAG: hypothetical protein WA154_12895 [Moraxellaceae bacterium]
MADNQQEDLSRQIMRLYLEEVKRRLTEEAKDLKAADLEHVRKLMQDNSITIASVQRGDFGTFAKEVAEQFPFQNDGRANFQ